MNGSVARVAIGAMSAFLLLPTVATAAPGNDKLEGAQVVGPTPDSRVWIECRGHG
ncbi:MAG TPA: hypothetical protein VFN89_06375 [Solirubrobacterales bacterium]|nr:hypothetical protein [Solirubrobacterales bacterium]